MAIGVFKLLVKDTALVGGYNMVNNQRLRVMPGVYETEYSTIVRRDGSSQVAVLFKHARDDGGELHVLVSEFEDLRDVRSLPDSSPFQLL